MSVLTPRPIAHRAATIPGEGAVDTLRQALALEAQGVDMIHLEIGQPDFPTPAHIVEAGIASLKAGRTTYGSAPGTPEMREAVADYLKETRGLSFASPEQVMIAPGGKPVIFHTITALVEPGDEVILPDPGFPTYAAVTQFAGATPISLPLRAATDFRIEVDELKSLITDRTKLIILNSPSNPTGGVIDQPTLEAIAELALQHNLWVLSDEIYSQLYYDDAPPPSIAAIPGMAERTVVLDGFSKSYSMTGWRLGYGHYPKPMLTAINNIIINNVTCTPLFVQDAGVAALRGSQDCILEMSAAYKKRRDVVVQALNEMPGVTCSNPAGAFYAMPDISGLDVPSTRHFVKQLLEAGVAILPGEDFGEHGTPYLRISYGTAEEKVAEGLARMRRVVEGLV